MPEILRQSVPAYAVGQVDRLPAVADHHDVQIDVALGQQRPQAAVEIVPAGRPGSGRRPRSSGAGAHRSRDELSTETRWPTTVIARSRDEPDQQPLGGQAAEPDVQHGGHEDQQRQLDGVEDAVERHEAGDPSYGPQQSTRRSLRPPRRRGPGTSRSSAATRAPGRSPPCSARRAARAAARGSSRRCRGAGRRPGRPGRPRSRTRPCSARPGRGRPRAESTSPSSARSRRRSSPAASAAGRAATTTTARQQSRPGRHQRGRALRSGSSAR